MKTFKVIWKRSALGVSNDSLIKADTEEQVLDIMRTEYKPCIVLSVTDTTTEEYQAAYDSEQFDSNGRRKF